MAIGVCGWCSSFRSGALSASERGMIANTAALNRASVVNHPTASINATARGENRNCPNEPAAVPAPNASERHSRGSSAPNAPMTRVNEEPASPKPINSPAER